MHNKKTFIFWATFFWLLPNVIFATQIFFQTTKQTFFRNEEFLVNVYLNTEGETVNTVGGKLVFPTGIVEVKEFRDGNSSIDFWIDKLNIKSLYNNDQTGIYFSGITPGGFNGPSNYLFSVIFRAKNYGQGVIDVTDLKVLKNDGIGTEVSSGTTPFTFLIASSSDFLQSPIISQDNDPPEDFEPSIASDPNIFAGKYFLVFATQDKGSGIDHYEVNEGNSGFLVAESPYLLHDQSLVSKIFVKAVDKAGNERISILGPQNNLPWYQQYGIFGIIMLIMVLIILFKNKWASFLQK